MQTRNLFLARGAIGALLLVVHTGDAFGAVTFTATDGDGRSAIATFDVSGGNLVVTLRNDAAIDTLIPTHILTCLFFEYSGGPLSLTPVSAFLDVGSTVHYGPTNGGNVGGEWAYVAGAVWPEGSGYGIGSAGLGIFDGPNFGGPNLQGPVGVDGLQYGITSTGDNPATGNAPVTGGHALIQDAVVFTLSGLLPGFDLNLIGNVWFQYGTSLDEPRTPTPGTLSLLGLGLGLALRRRR
jgi:MYXO-CTERM domain-containing protein